jgi:hypothetical protein
MSNPGKSEVPGVSAPVQAQDEKVKDADDYDPVEDMKEKPKDVKKSRRQLYKEAKAGKAADKLKVDTAQKDQQGGVLKNFFVSFQVDVEFQF